MENLEILDLEQGSDQWKIERANSFTASEAPAMMGEHKFITRNQLLQQKSTGIVPEVSRDQQERFDAGHRAEAATKPIIEAKFMEDLLQKTGRITIDGMSILASLDGIFSDHTIIWENKILNQTVVAMVKAEDLSAHYYWQLEQQLLVFGAEKAYFTTSDGTVANTHGCWYVSRPERRAALIAGWKQFREDLANYQHVEIVEPIKVTQEVSFPVVVLNVTGSLSSSNLDNVTPKFDLFLSTVKTELKTDEDFAHGESNAKLSRSAAKALKAKAKEVIDQVASISDAIRTLESYAVKFDAMGLKLEKAVKEQKDSIKLTLIAESKNKYASHIADLNKRIGTNYLSVQYPDFALAVKNKRTVASLHEACDTLLAQSKIAANADADRISINLQADGLKDYHFLFSDLPVLVHKANDDFSAIVSQRVAQHQTKEAERIAAETARIAEQERVKAEAKAAADLAAAREADRADQAERNKEQTTTFPAIVVESDSTQPASFMTKIAVDQPAVQKAWSEAQIPVGRVTEIARPRASTRSLVDNILDDLSEGGMQEVLQYLRENFVKQAA
jgi:predicted phage-related endonuclease